MSTYGSLLQAECRIHIGIRHLRGGPTLREDSEASSEATFSCSSVGTLPCVRLSLLPPGLRAVGSRSTGLVPSRSRLYSWLTRLPVLFLTRACITGTAQLSEAMMDIIQGSSLRQSTGISRP